MDKKITHRRKHSFFDSKRSWIDRCNWEKYLIGNSKACSEPSLRWSFLRKYLLIFIKYNTKIPTAGKMPLLENLLNSIFEKQLNIIRESLKKFVQAFSSKIDYSTLYSVIYL